MKTIPLTKGYFTKVDDDDYKKFAIYRWCVHLPGNTNYPRAARVSYVKGEIKLWLHREILNAPKGKYVDHINGDTLDNRKCNLRLCTLSQNNMNTKIYKNNASSYKGVCWFESQKKWAARISKNNNRLFLGYFKKKEEAALAYNEKAKVLFGEFAKLNIILARTGIISEE